MRKLFLSGVLVLAALCLFSTCSKKKEGAGGQAGADKIKVGFVYIGSINDVYTGAHDKGRKALEEAGYTCVYIENVSENAADCKAAINALLDQNCNVIYTTSFGYMDPTLEAAEAHPDVKFAHCSGYKTAPNMARYFGKIYQPRYLSGIAAGYKTKSNKIGYVAAMPIPEVIRGINAFTLGARSVNPDAVVEVVWTNTWNDPALEKSAALELLNRGADVIAQHEDSTAAQIAAQERGAFAIGYDQPSPEAAPKAYLTAPVFNWASYYLANVKSVEDGTWEGTAYWGSLAEGAVALDTLTALNDPRAPASCQAAQAEIIAGTLEPFTGPIKDQSGAVKVADGVRMSDDEIWNMSWFVEGVSGTIPN